MGTPPVFSGHTREISGHTLEFSGHTPEISGHTPEISGHTLRSNIVSTPTNTKRGWSGRPLGAFKSLGPHSSIERAGPNAARRVALYDPFDSRYPEGELGHTGDTTGAFVG